MNPLLFPRNQSLDGSLVATDPYFSSVVLLAFNDNQADGTTSFDDQSNANHTLTTNGGAQYDTAQAPTGMTSSLLLDGAGDYVTSASHADWAMGTGDFTWECYLRANGNVSGTKGIIVANSTALALLGAATNDLLMYAGGTRITGDLVIVPNTWQHVAMCKSSGVSKLFVNGSQVGSDYSDSDNYSQGLLEIGTWLGGLYWNGWLCSMRLTKGVARYTGSFTPPALPLPTS